MTENLPMTMQNLAPAATSRYDDLLEPVSDAAACGDDLEYDPAFIMLQAAVAPSAPVQYGDFVETPASVNWAEAERECEALLARTKDLRVAIILLRAAVRLRGAAGLRDGMVFLQALLERYGSRLHPLPYFDGEWDPVTFANALAALADAEGALADVREIPLPKAAGAQLQLRDIEKALAMPRQKDALAPESVTRMLKELAARGEAVVLALGEAHGRLAQIAAWATSGLKADAPNLAPLSRLLQPFSEIDRLVEPAPAAQPPAPVAEMQAGRASAPDLPNPVPRATTPPPHAAPTATTVPTAPAMDRWTALATIRQVREWFEDNEPSSPVTVMLREAERMVGKRFSELAQSIPLDLLAKWDAVDN
jgi:type VI secretion system protein ImpA